MQSQLSYYKKLAEALSGLLSPMAEISLFNNTSKEICCFNRRPHQDSLSLKPYKETSLTLKKSQSAKALKIPLDENYYLQIILETTLFDQMKNFLQHYLKDDIQDKSITSWEKQVENEIQTFTKKHNANLNNLNAKQKRQLIFSLQEKGIFKYKDASNTLAKRLDLSRATIYNYLKLGSQLKSIIVHQVDAFTDEPFSGNPAGVVLNADALDVNLMKKITREMNLSETSFALTSQKADLRLRYFTPSSHEVKFCGHSTVGALFMIAHNRLLGIDKSGKYPFSIETAAGILPAEVHLQKNDAITIQFETPKIRLVKSLLTHKMLAKQLGINLSDMDTSKPIMFEKTNQDVYITIKSLKQLGDIQVNQKSAKHFAEKNNIVAYCLLCDETFSKNHDIHMRCYAPAVGIPEDPFTGSVLGGLSAYLIKNKIIKNTKNIAIEQGHFIDRPGHVDIEITQNGSTIKALVKAKARHFFSTDIKL